LLACTSICAGAGCARRTASNDASGTSNCSLPVSTHSGSDDARKQLQRDMIAGVGDRAYDMRGAERRMTGERHLERRSEDPHAPCRRL
jgi:hypothetical protein